MKTTFVTPILIILTMLIVLPISGIRAQIDIDLEKIKEKCKDKPIEDRITVTVARFNVTTKSQQANASFNDELASIATNALQKVNCFTVLENLTNLSDLTNELEMGSSKFVDQDAAASIGKMYGAHAVFIGEITSFEQNDVGVGVAGLSVGTNKTTIEFVPKLINIQSRELIWSESVEATGLSKKTKLRAVLLETQSNGKNISQNIAKLEFTNEGLGEDMAYLKMASKKSWPEFLNNWKNYKDKIYVTEDF